MIFSRLIKKKSGHVAKQRLAAVLVSDRARCAPDTLANIQSDISNALEKYIEINLKTIDFKIVSREKEVPVLVVYIPFKEIVDEPTKQHLDSKTFYDCR